MNENLTKLLFSSPAAKALKSAGATDSFLDGIKAVPAEGEFIYVIRLWDVRGDPLSGGRNPLADDALRVFALQKYLFQELMGDESERGRVLTELAWREIHMFDMDNYDNRGQRKRWRTW